MASDKNQEIFRLNEKGIHVLVGNLLLCNSDEETNEQLGEATSIAIWCLSTGNCMLNYLYSLRLTEQSSNANYNERKTRSSSPCSNGTRKPRESCYNVKRDGSFDRVVPPLQ